MNILQGSTSSNFLFVTSKAGGKSKEARTHVERQIRRRKRNCRPKLQATSGSDSKYYSTPLGIAIDAKNREHNIYVCAKIKASDLDTTDTEYQTRRAGAITGPIVISPTHILQAGASDPFGTTIVPIDAALNKLMHYSRQWYLESKWSLGYVLGKLGHSEAVWVMEMKNALCDAATFYAALVVAYQHAASLYRRPYSTTPSFQALYYKVSSLKAVRERLYRGPSPGMVQAILDLAAAEYFAGNTSEALIHLEATKSVINALGGLENLNENIRDFVGLSDYVLSWTFLKKPVFPIENYDPGPWRMQGPSTQPLAFCKAFSSALEETWVGNVTSELLSVFLKSVLADLRETLVIRWVMVTTHEDGSRDKILRWLHIRSTALYMQLLDHYLSKVGNSRGDHQDDEEVDRPLSAAVCLALRYSHSLIMYTPSIITKHFPAQQVYGALENTVRASEARSTHHRRLFLWLYFIGAVIEELGDIHEINGQEFSFLGRFQAMVTVLDLRSKETVGDVLRCFLYAKFMDKYIESFL